MVWKHGLNIPHRSDYEEILKEFNLLKEEVTSNHILQADEEARRRALGNSKDNEIFWEYPIEEEWSTSNVTHWKSRCGRYRVTYSRNLLDEVTRYVPMIRRKGNGLDRWDSISYTKNGDCKDYKTLIIALEAVESHHCEYYKLTSVITNKHSVSNENPSKISVRKVKSEIKTWLQIQNALFKMCQQRGLTIPEEYEE